MLRREFPAHTYLTLNESADRQRAKADPEAFLVQLRGPAIIDDLHRAPELAAWLAAAPYAGPVLFASSRRLEIPFATIEIYHPTRAERERRAPVGLEMLGQFAPAVSNSAAAPEWQTGDEFLEKDLWELVKVHDFDRFERFLGAARSRSAATLDQQSLANECGVSHRTAVRWLAALDACFVTLRVDALEETMGRRTVRSPKLHFLRSGAFESEVLWELYRNDRHSGGVAAFCYWRDSNGMEIPLVLERESGELMPVMVAANPSPAEVARLRRWMELAGVTRGAVIAERTAPARTSGGILRYTREQL